MGFDSPNLVGAFFSALLPFVWALQYLRNKACYSLALVLEFIFFVLICKTYSRGALLSCTFCAFLIGIYEFRYKGRKAFNALFFRLFLLATVFCAVGGLSRISMNIEADRSVINRPIVWQGGIRMILAGPFGGWGELGTGWNFVQWWGPLNGSIHVGNLLNGLLEIGARSGFWWPLLALLLFFYSLIVTFFSLASRIPEFSIVVLTASPAFSLATIFFCNVFSVCLRGYIFPAVFVIVFLLNGRTILTSFQRWKQWLSISAIASLVIVVGSVIAADPFDQRVKYLNGSVEFRGLTKMQSVVLLDREIDGDDCGLLMRRMMSARTFESDVTFTVFPMRPPTTRDSKKGVCSGRMSMYINTMPGIQWVVVHPKSEPPKMPISIALIVLPRFDATRLSNAWRSYALKNDIRFEWSEAGTRINPTELQEIVTRFVK